MNRVGPAQPLDNQDIPHLVTNESGRMNRVGPAQPLDNQEIPHLVKLFSALKHSNLLQEC